MQPPVANPVYVWLRILRLLFKYEVVGLSVPASLLRPRFNAIVYIVSCVRYSRAGRLPVFAPFAPGSDVGRGVPSKSPSPENSGALW